MYEIRKYQVRFLTPAFLGNAEQNGQWRTPPFKALLRQWWRVAYAASHGFDVDVDKMKFNEGRLFGHAWLKNDTDSEGRSVSARKSVVRIRLAPWADGRLSKMPRTPKIGAGRISIASGLYLGYGPVKSETGLKMNHPIGPEESSLLEIGYPSDEEGAEWIEKALGLIHWYGTIGGRSRNGWGSLTLEPVDGTPAIGLETVAYQRDWRQALKVEWSHALGKDETGALIWTTATHDRWEEVVGELGRIRKQLNGACKGTERMILNQPVKGKGARVPSSLRFKLRKSGSGSLYGVVVHMPCTPDVIKGNPSATEKVWRRVHELLDADSGLQRLPQ